jgi:hypothetical protein
MSVYIVAITTEDVGNDLKRKSKEGLAGSIISEKRRKLHEIRKSKELDSKGLKKIQNKKLLSFDDENEDDGK